MVKFRRKTERNMQKLKSQGKELPNEKEMIIKDLKITKNLRNGAFLVYV